MVLSHHATCHVSLDRYTAMHQETFSLQLCISSVAVRIHIITSAYFETGQIELRAPIFNLDSDQDTLKTESGKPEALTSPKRRNLIRINTDRQCWSVDIVLQQRMGGFEVNSTN